MAKSRKGRRVVFVPMPISEMAPGATGWLRATTGRAKAEVVAVLPNGEEQPVSVRVRVLFPVEREMTVPVWDLEVEAK